MLIQGHYNLFNINPGYSYQNLQPENIPSNIMSLHGVSSTLITTDLQQALGFSFAPQFYLPLKHIDA
jgi:hypothetical protein